MLEHQHLIVRAETRLTPRSVTDTLAWFRGLVEAIGMRLIDLPHNPNCFYMNTPGNRGLTCVGIIETSHIALHCWDEQDPGLFQLDIYSCKAFDPARVVEHFACFDPVRVEYKFLDRQNGLVELPLPENGVCPGPRANVVTA